MECIDRIFYRKVNPSDFKKLYNIDVPESGGGQTYLEAAGISNSEITDFLSFAEITESPLVNEERFKYLINAYVLGGTDSDRDFIEFAPRGGRNNYRISRQNMKYKHPAWDIKNGFPEPTKDEAGEYLSSESFEGVIDNLLIGIIRTTYRKYYACFFNYAEIPADWPQNVGLDVLFTGDRRGVLNIEHLELQFKNNHDNPFGGYSGVEGGERRTGGKNILLYGVPGSGKSWTIEHEYCKIDTKVERVVFHPDYTNADFVGQILPVVDPDDKMVSYEFTPGPFTTILRNAYRDPHHMYVLIIEEINRGNAPAIFGDIFQLLDRLIIDKEINEEFLPKGTSEYGITNENLSISIYGNPNTKVRIPSNLSILGTMNTSDQNVFTLDTAFQRRWQMRLVENSFENVRDSLANSPILDTGVTWQRFCETINKIIIANRAKMASAEDKRLGVYFIHEQDLVLSDAILPSTDFSELSEEYNYLLKVEKNQNLTTDESRRLQSIRDALAHIRIFPEKIIKYLWDDAFKFNPEALFDADMDNLEKIIRWFVFSVGEDRLRIFKQSVREVLLVQ